MSNTVRFSGFPWFNEEHNNFTVTIGGAGGIGSWLAIMLARADFNIYLVDFDTIEHHNLGGQFFKRDQISFKKVKAVRDIVEDLTDNAITTSTSNIEDVSITSTFFSCFDNMNARKESFRKWKEETYPSSKKIFIDGRLSGELIQIFVVTPDRAGEYERDHLFDDSEVEELHCTLKQTSHSAAMIASHMMGFFTNFLTNLYTEEDMREVPFMYEYSIPMNYTEIIF